MQDNSIIREVTRRAFLSHLEDYITLAWKVQNLISIKCSETVPRILFVLIWCSINRACLFLPRNLLSKRTLWASLVAQWLRIRLPMQGTRVQALLWEDPTCRGATKPVSHNYWVCTPEPMSHIYWARVPQLLKPMLLEPVLRNERSLCTITKSSPRSPQLEKACAQQQRSNTDKNK